MHTTLQSSSTGSILYTIWILEIQWSYSREWAYGSKTNEKNSPSGSNFFSRPCSNYTFGILPFHSRRPLRPDCGCARSRSPWMGSGHVCLVPIRLHKTRKSSLTGLRTAHARLKWSTILFHGLTACFPSR